MFNHDGTYYLYYSVSTLGSQESDIGVATSDSVSASALVQDHCCILRRHPQSTLVSSSSTSFQQLEDVFCHRESCTKVRGLVDSNLPMLVLTAHPEQLELGSWKDHGSIGILPDPKYNRIDPNLFRYNEDSAYYLSFGSYWDNIFQVEMDDPPLKVAGHPAHLEQNTTSRPDDLPESPVEGSYQFWWTVDDTDYFYLFFSSGACCNEPPDLVPKGEEYKITVCRSTSATAGFKDKDGKDCLTENGGTLVLGSHGDVYAPGGQGERSRDSVVL